MKHLLIFFLALFSRVHTNAQEQSELSFPPNGDNEKAEVSQWVGLVKITITYHSPDVHDPAGADRRGHIWGELVPFGLHDEGNGSSKAIPWRAGANESTNITFSHDVQISGKSIPRGTYGLFLDVEKDGPWYWIISTHIGWGSFQYDPAFDILRIPASPEDAPYTEWLTFGFDDRKPNSATAFLQWENKRAAFKIDVPNVDQLYVDQIRKELLAWPGFKYQNWQNAARFCALKKINLDEALIWIDKAIYDPFRGVGPYPGVTLGRREFSTFQTKALVLTTMGRPADADAAMDEAIHQSGVLPFELFTYVNRLIGSKRNDKALEVAKYAYKLRPEEKFWTVLALAYAYSATNDKKSAEKNWELAIQNVPEAQKNQLPVYESQLKKIRGT